MSSKRAGSRRPQGWTAWLARVRAAQMAVGAGLVLVVGFFYVTLASSERKVEHPIPHRYDASDPQFVRTMGSLFGPGFVGGNRITPLLNGDEVFPGMLAAIRAARQTITFES